MGYSLAVRLLALVVLGMAVPAAADVSTKLSQDVWVDWSRGLVMARAGAIGPDNAPSPKVARLSAEKTAWTRMQKRLLPAVAGLPTSGGKAGKSDALTKVVEGALRLDVEHGTDGTTLMTGGVPIAAVRDAVLGGPTVAPGPDAPTALVVDARAHLKRPMLDLVIGRLESPRSPVLYFRAESEALGDPRLGDKVVRATSTGLEKNVLSIDDDGAATRGASLTVVLLGAVK